MRAVVISAFGGPEVLAVAEVEPPVPGPGQVRVQVAAAAVNPTDALLRSGAQQAFLGDLPGPYIPGMDLAGVVDQVGEGVTALHPGDRVMGAVSPWRPAGGAQAALVALPAASLVATPEGMSDEDACTLPMNGLTVHSALSTLALGPGDTIAVFGAAGAIGGMSVQQAKARGLNVVAVASDADRETVEAMGADLFVARGDDAARIVRDETRGGVDGIIDAAKLGQSMLAAARDEGHVVTLMPFTGATERGIVIDRVFVIDDLEKAEAVAEVGELAARGVLTPRVAQVLAPEQAGDAHRMLGRGGLRGRPVITF
ncbi:NADP-dependent oxidoreductase [Pseudonocardia sp. KRD291]|uniref:quinone oxidoreductase family protein n=1 Tax=Pseudonocardia sp. KRD291 TaxID=2792007 RepID=UPI001C4A2071|nr:NADP-dependent oxidoreductase [Pseudonocardia sp. KRD291]MBW0101887.1 NADP-dependent oxidoreductase [Pseudonocardia sp. KRD291]